MFVDWQTEKRKEDVRTRVVTCQVNRCTEPVLQFWLFRQPSYAYANRPIRLLQIFSGLGRDLLWGESGFNFPGVIWRTASDLCPALMPRDNLGSLLTEATEGKLAFCMHLNRKARQLNEYEYHKSQKTGSSDHITNHQWELWHCQWVSDISEEIMYQGKNAKISQCAEVSGFIPNRNEISIFKELNLTQWGCSFSRFRPRQYFQEPDPDWPSGVILLMKLPNQNATYNLTEKGSSRTRGLQLTISTHFDFQHFSHSAYLTEPD